ncbi:tape measure protein [Acinetobacter sp. 102]|uniref:tape measure protein n=1 Tax=Acinetobacter sp. 102 TaxID=3098766 RepID=UPI00300AA191
MATNSLDFLLNLRANSEGFNKGIDGAKFAVNALVGAMAALGVGLGAKELIETADAYNVLAAKIKIATQEGGNFAEAMNGVQKVAISTNTSLEATATLFTKVNEVGKQMGLTQQQTLSLTETISKAMQLGGGSAQASEAAVVQLTQALQSGVLRGDEFNSIMEQAPGISKILAQELGVTTGELRKLAENGELTSSRVIKAFQNQSDAVSAEYAQMPMTVSNALQKVSTAWTVLIGELDSKAGGATGAIAQVISELADHMGVVKIIFDDVMAGIDAIGERYSSLADDGTILAFKNAIGALYDTFKNLVSTAFDLGKSIDDVFGVIIKNAIGTLGSFFGVVQDGNTDLNLVNTTLNGISIALGLVSDAVSGAKIAIEFISGAILGFAGNVLKAQGGILDFIPLMGGVAEQAKINGERLLAEGAKLISKAHDDAMGFESETKKRLDRSIESETQASARILGEKRKALDETLSLQSEEGLGNAKLQAQKLAAVEGYVNDAVKANNGILEKDLQLELAKKGYYTTVSEGGKVVVSTLTEQEQATVDATLKTKQQEEAFRGASAAGQKFGIDVSAEVNKVSKEFINTKGSLTEFSTQLRDAGISGEQSADLIYQAWVKWLGQAKNTAEIDIAKSKLMEMGVAGQVSGDQLNAGFKLADSAAKDLNPTLNAAREAGKALGVDIDKTANIMSQGFGQGSYALDDLKQKLKEAGVTGQEASNTLYRGWEAWLAKADSQVELDAAKAKLKEYESQGVFSTRQVEMGMFAIKQATAKLPDDLDEVGKAFERLGVKTKEQLKLAADSAIADFNTMKASGQATSEGLKQAYERVMQAAAASGDQAVIANAKAQGASVGLQAQIDATGKSSVKSTQEIVDELYKVGDTARGSASQGFRDLGRVAREEAQSTADEWEAAMKKVDAERKAQAASSAKGMGQAMDDMNAKAADYEKRLAAAGMDAGQAKKAGKDALDSMMFAYSQALKMGSVTDFSTPLLKKMDDTLAYWEGKKSGSGGSSVSVPNIKAPSIEAPKMPSASDINIPNPKPQVYRFEFDGKVIELNGDPSQQDLVNDFFNQLEQAKKRM